MPFPNEVAALEALNVRVSRGLKRLARQGHQGGKLAEPLNEAVDHQLRANGDHVILEYGDYECPYSRAAYREIQRVAREVEFRFVFRHFPLTEIHPRALAAAAAAEAAALQGQFWEMHDWLFRHQRTLTDGDLQAAAAELALDPARFDRDHASRPVLDRIGRDVESGVASGEIRGTPTLFVEGVIHRGGYDAATLRAVLARVRRSAKREGAQIGES